MRFLSVHDLRGKSAKVWKDLPEEREMVVPVTDDLSPYWLRQTNRMKIVVDTNVLVAGLLSPYGPCGEIVRWRWRMTAA